MNLQMCWQFSIAHLRSICNVKYWNLRSNILQTVTSGLWPEVAMIRITSTLQLMQWIFFVNLLVLYISNAKLPICASDRGHEILGLL